MPTEIQYALLSANVYGNSVDVRSGRNTLQLPFGWSVIPRPGDPTGRVVSSSSFMATAYRNAAGEMVISYAGTTDFFDYLTGNIAVLGATVTPQVHEAAKFYLDLLRDNPDIDPLKVTFTGHSLGGGLASLMAVFFDRPAMVFDEAPFALSADSLAVYDALCADLVATGHTLPPALLSYVPLVSRTTRAGNVHNRYIDGGILSLSGGLAKIEGSADAFHPHATSILWWGGNIFPDQLVPDGGEHVDLHSMSLMAGFMESSGFVDAATTHKELLARIFKGLYPNDPTSPRANLLDVLVQRQIAGEHALDVLGADVALIRADGLESDTFDFNQNGTHLNMTVAAALVDVELAGLYEQGRNRTPAQPLVSAFKDVLSTVGNGVAFDARDLGTQAPIGLQALETYLHHDTGIQLNTALLEQARWVLQSGTAALNYEALGDDRSDVVIAYSGANTAHGGGGNDFLVGGGGNDYLYGDAGNDVIYDQAGDDHLFGGDGTDQLIGGVGDDTLTGGGGSDLLQGDAGNDKYMFSTADLSGSRSFDTIIDGDHQGRIYIDDLPLLVGDRLSETTWKSLDGYFWIIADLKKPTQTLVIRNIATGSSIVVQDWSNSTMGITLGGTVQPINATPISTDDDVISPSADNVFVPVVADGLIGNDFLAGGFGNDILIGGGGDDYLSGGLGADTLIGGDGNDFINDQQLVYVDRSGLSPDALNLWHQNNVVGVNGVAVVGNGWLIRRLPDGSYQVPASDGGGSVDLSQAADNDIAIAGAGDDHVWMTEGNDFIGGGDGNDTLVGGADNDVVSGDAGDDVIFGDATSYLPFANTTIAGNDVLTGGSGNDTIVGNGGSDIIDGGDDADVLYGDNTVEIVGGLALADQVTGDDIIDGGAGIDLIQGGGGNDTIDGGIGADVIYGDNAFTGHLADYRSFDGNDTIHGGEGNDQIAGMGGNDTIYGDAGNDTILGDHESISAANGGDDTLYGGAGDDSIAGNGGNDLIDGGVGNDQLQGNEGNDTINGGADADVLFGNAGDDVLDGGQGNDQLTGDAGVNRYLFGVDSGSDIIFNADAGQATNSVVQFTAGITPENIKLQTWGDSLIITVNLTTKLEIKGFLQGPALTPVGSFQFTDGTIWTYADLYTKLLASTPGNDVIGGFAIADTISGGGGADDINGRAGDDTLSGGGGNDRIVGGIGNDTLDGGVGDDRLFGYGGLWLDDPGNANSEAGNDVLRGGTGYDELYGGQGNDTYLYDRGDGSDLISESPNAFGASTDTLRLGAGILPEHVSLYRDGSNLIVVIDGSNQQITISGYFLAEDYQIERIEFDGGQGAVWKASDISSRTISGVPNTMNGTIGNDVFAVDNAEDVVIEAAAGGTDLIESSVTYTLPANVENLTLTGIINANGSGNSADNVLRGNAGNNILNGYGGNDTAYGGAGDDSYYYVEHVFEETSGGTDTIYVGEWQDGTFGNVTLADNVENVHSTTYYFNSFRTLIGNSLDNRMVMVNGSNMLVYTGSMDGGAGADYYEFDAGPSPGYVTIYLDNPNDTWKGLGAAQFDIRSYLSTDFTFDGTIREFHAIGTSAASVIGDANNNTIYLNESTAVNRAAGGGGDDLYYIGANDVVVEDPSGGTDKVVIMDGSGTVYHLPENVENILVSGFTITQTYGNALDNRIEGRGSIYGLDGNDILIATGSAGSNQIVDGGSGADDMRGDSNSQTYYVDNVMDSITETYTGSEWSTIDKVVSSIDYVLPANIENLELIGNAHNATGNDRSNAIIGNSSNNIITSGKGDDSVYGMGGADTYIFNRGDGLTIIYETANVAGEDDVLKLGAGINPADVEIRHRLDSSQLEVLISDPASNLGYATDQVWIRNYSNGISGVEKIEFADGTIWIVDAHTVNNLPPTAGPQVTAQEMIEGQLYIFTLPENLFINEPNDTLNLNFVDIPNWLTYSPANRSLVGTPPDGAASGSLAIVATDSWGQTAITSISYAVLNSITGSAVNDTLVGTSGRDALYGYEGNDSLNGGGNADRLTGGSGDDTYTVDNIGDIVVELANEGSDLVNASISYTLGDYVERLTLTGTSAINATGNTLDNVLTGNTAANTLTGGAGNDTLDGGAGNDTMIGGIGNDTYVVDSGSDVITENANEGTDSVNASVSYTLSANVENLTLTGTVAINATGNGYDNLLTGNSGANVLDGGIGADTLVGGAGNDTYVVDNAGDVVTEAASAGTDIVQSSITYALGANVENLTLTGTAAINATGNALNNVLTGNAGNNVLDGGVGADTLIGGLGNDTYMVDNTGDLVTESTSGGTDTVQSSITYTLGSNVENLTLTGTTAINGTGNILNNVVTGNAGNNVLDGGAGTDTLSGGLGNDTYVVDNIGDLVTENANEGTDTVQSSVTYTLGANVENLTLTGTAAINGTGNAFNNVVTGNAVNNVLDGGLGADTLIGGLGNDTYVVENIGDLVTESASGGTDTVQSSVTYTLGANVENLTLTGAAALNGTGNASSNVLTGNAGDNTLDGGAGIDTLIGGLGNDTYVVDNIGDLVTESASGGTDTVQSSVTYTLGANVENLTLTGTTAINGTGNILNNVLTGNAGANVLDGGAGTDMLSGGLGNDTYVVDNIGDVITENANEGTDSVQSSVTYTLAANVENLTLTGTTAINGTGNVLDNGLIGNSAVNTLTGGAGNDTLNGGVGADTLVGGLGNDLYVVDNIGDVVTENLNEGTDTVQSSVTYTLAANVENLTLTGAAALNGTGNILNNVLTGNAGANVLDGGAGTDALSGGLGNDTYVVDNIGDVVTENANEGTDSVQSSVTYTLAGNVENLTLTGAAVLNGTGNALDNVLTGNSAINTLTGGAGNDMLDGDAGADKLLGGLGNDTYVVDNAGDVVTENANEGTDTVNSSITSVLDANVENLTLTGAAAINGTGNVLNNGLIGNASNNVLDGGAGADTLQGGQGNDSLIGGVGNDTYTFALGWGNDTLTDYDIAANSDLVSFGAGITSSAMTFKQVGNDLICSGPGGTDSITIKNWYLGSANQIEQFAFADGTILSASQISGLVTSMALATKGSTVSTDSIGHASTTNNNSLAGPDRKYGGDAGYHIMSSESPPVFTDDAIADGFAHPFLELTSTPSFVTPASHPHQTDIGMTSRTMMADPSGHIFPFEPSPGLYDDAAGASPPTLAGFPWDQSPSSIPWYEVGDDLTRTHRLVELMAGMGGSSVEPGYRNLPQYDHAHSWIP